MFMCVQTNSDFIIVNVFRVCPMREIVEPDGTFTVKFNCNLDEQLETIREALKEISPSPTDCEDIIRDIRTHVHKHKRVIFEASLKGVTIRNVSKTVITNIHANSRYYCWAFEFDGDRDSITIDWNVFMVDITNISYCKFQTPQEIIDGLLKPLYKFIDENRQLLTKIDTPDLVDVFLEFIATKIAEWNICIVEEKRPSFKYLELAPDSKYIYNWIGLDPIFRSVGKIVILRIIQTGVTIYEQPHTSFYKWIFRFDGGQNLINIDWVYFEKQIAIWMNYYGGSMNRGWKFPQRVLAPLYDFVTEKWKDLIDPNTPLVYDEFLLHLETEIMSRGVKRPEEGPYKYSI